MTRLVFNWNKRTKMIQMPLKADHFEVLIKKNLQNALNLRE